MIVAKNYNHRSTAVPVKNSLELSYHIVQGTHCNRKVAILKQCLHHHERQCVVNC